MQAQDRKKRLCIVSVCHGERFDLVHKFPSDNARAEKWRNILDIPHLYDLSLDQIRKRYFICSRHFKISDYKNIESRGLNKTAEPSKNLTVLNDFDTIDQKFQQTETGATAIVVVQQDNQHHTDVTADLPKDYVPAEEGLANSFIETVKVEAEYSKIARSKRKLEIQGDVVLTKRAGVTHKLNLENNKEKFLSVLAPVGELKELGQLVFHINHVESPADRKEEINKMFLLPMHEKQADGKEAVDLIDEPPFSNFEETGAQEVIVAENTPLLEEDEYEVIVDQDKQSEEENSDIVEILMPENEKDDEEEHAISDTLDIIHPGYPEPLKFHHFWLRDHCRCELCYSTETFQRKFNIMDLPIDIKAKDCTIEDKALSVEWSDGHNSSYDLDFLYRAKYENHRRRLIGSDLTTLWDKNSINELDYARVNFSDYLANADVSKNVVLSLVKYGVAFIEKVPPTVQSTEIAVRNLFPIHRTFYGEMFTVHTDRKEFQDSAYSKEFLPAHTDNTYFPEASGLQILHCTHHNGTGGETILVDGFKAATELKRKYPVAFERLLYTNVPSEYLDDVQNHYDCSPHIKLNTVTSELEQIRFNLYDRAPLHSIPHNDIMDYYRDFRLLANEVQSPQNEWWFKLNPGTVMLFNNWRVLHGRAQYTGKRSLAGAYVSRTDFMSKARVFGILDN